jgi:hypothetical protein
MKIHIKKIKRIWILNFVRRIVNASQYYNKKYVAILKWGITSNEDTNYTYDLTKSNLLYLALTISFVVSKDYKVVLQYINEA